MANITIRGLEESTKNKLRVRAALRQRSMEAEAREILRDALDGTEQADADLAARIVGRFQSLGGVDLKIAPREPLRDPPRLATRMRRKWSSSTRSCSRTYVTFDGVASTS